MEKFEMDPPVKPGDDEVLRPMDGDVLNPMDDEILKPQDDNKQRELRRLSNHAVYLLHRRDHSAFELRSKLKQKGYEPDDISLVIEELLESGYLNESRFTENFIRWRRQKGYGPERIAQELSGKGITDSMIALHLDFTDNAWFTEAATARRKHFKNQEITDFKVKAKQMRFLKYRGFTHEQIQSAFGKLEAE